MEFLVTMTTQVPAGTSDSAVDLVRNREAAHSRRLASQGRVLRLWHPPLGPGEWRTIGLFDARDVDEMERTLVAMPLRVWRTDQITPLGPHPNDPGRAIVPRAVPGREYLVRFELGTLVGTGSRALEEAISREAASARDLAAAGYLARLWSLGPAGHALGLWRADDDAALDVILKDLPLARWLSTTTTPLFSHPNDPGSHAGEPTSAQASDRRSRYRPPSTSAELR